MLNCSYYIAIFVTFYMCAKKGLIINRIIHNWYKYLKIFNYMEKNDHRFI